MIKIPKKLSPKEIDTIDRKILRRIQDNGRITNAELAEQVGLSAAACHKRVKRLDNLGVIQAYTAIIDPRAAGYNQNAFVHITLHTQGSDTIEAQAMPRPICDTHSSAGSRISSIAAKPDAPSSRLIA